MSINEGKLNPGIDYQFEILTYTAACLSENKEVENFWIYTSRDVPIFDDIIVKVKYESENRPFVYLCQVKRYKKDKINFNSGKDQLQKYLPKIWEIKEPGKRSQFLKGLLEDVPADNIEFWYISNSFWSNSNNYASTDPLRNPIKLGDNIKCYLEPDTTYKSIFPLRNGVSCYKLITERCQRLPLNLRKLYFFLKQPNNYEVASKIVNLNKNLISSETANDMINFVNAYLKPKTEERVLTKYIFETHLLKLCLSPFIVSPTEAFEIDARLSNNWNSLVMQFDVTLTTSQMEGYVFGCLWQEIIKLYDSHFNWNAIITHSRNMTEEIAIEDKFKQLVHDKGVRHWLYIPDRIENLLVEMWKCDYLPLILNANINVSILDKYKHLGKRFVILNRKEKLYHELTRLDLRIFATAADIHKTELASEFLKSILISLQGREPIRLFSILNDDRDLMKELQCDQLLYFIRERKKLLSSAQDFENARIKDEDGNDFFVKNDRVVPIIGRCFSDNKIYISRHLRKPTVEETIRDSERKVICLLTGDLNSIDWPMRNYYNLLNKSIDDIVSKVEPETKQNEAAFIGTKDEHVEGLWSEFSSSEHALLHIKMKHGMMILLKHRNCRGLSSHVSFSGPKFNAETFFEKTSTGITVITGEPGSGKSTLLRSLFNACDKHSFALFCDLKNYPQDLYKRDEDLFKDPMNFILRKEEEQLTQLSNKLYSNQHLNFLRKLLEKTEELILFLDSFDEVLPECEEQVLDFIRVLNKSNGRCIIGSRLDKAYILGEHFEVTLLKIDTLSETDIEEYLNKELPDSNLDEYPLEFRENPLFLGFLIKLKRENALPDDITSSSLYAAIIDKNIEHLFHEKNKWCIPERNYESWRKVYLKIYKELALLEIFNDTVITELKLNYEELRDQLIFSKKSKLGLIVQFNDKGPIFLHRTIAEFLVAEWLAENIDKDYGKRMYAMLLEDYREHTRHLLDDILCRNLALHQAIIQKDLPKVKSLCSADDKYLREVDKLDRSALDVAAIYCSDYTREDLNYLILEEIVQQIIKKQINSFERNSSTNSHWTYNLQRRHEMFLYEVSRLKLAHTAEMYFYCKNKITEGITWGIKNDMLDTAMALLRKDIHFLGSCFSDFLLKVVPAMRSDLLFELIEFKSSTSPELAELCRACRNLLPLTEVSKLANLKMEDWGFTAIHIACMSGSADVVRELISSGVDVNAVDVFGRQPLYYAIGAGSTEIVTILAKSFKSQANIKDKCGRRVFPNYLHCCIRKNYLEIAEILLDEGFDRDEKDAGGRTALHIAVEKCIDEETDTPKPDVDDSNINQIKFLLEHKLNVDARDDRGQTPLHIALWYNRLDVFEMLLRHGANPNIEDNYYDRTPLCTAIKKRNHEAVTLLLKYGADVYKTAYYGKTALFALFKDDDIDGLFIDDSNDIDGFFIDDYNDFDNFSSIQHIIKALVNMGADVNHQSNNGETALMFAARQNFYKIATMLLENGAEVNLQDKHGDTALHVAVIYRSDEPYRIVEALVEKGANVNHQNNDGETALMIAIDENFSEVAIMLLENGAEVHLRDKHGNTALHVAVRTCFFQFYRALDIFCCYKLFEMIKDRDIQLLLLLDMEIIEMLLKGDADNRDKIEDARARTAADLLKVLIDKGADVDAANGKGRTALDVAIKYKTLISRGELASESLYEDDYRTRWINKFPEMYRQRTNL